MEERTLTGYPSIDKPWLKYYSEEAKNAKLPECTIYEYLWENNRDHLGDIALDYFGKKTTYGQLFERIDEATRAFVALGVKEGDTVPIAMASTPEMVVAFYALNKLGAVSNWVDLRTFEESICEATANGATALVIHDFCLDMPIRTELLSCLQHIIVVSVANGLPFVKKAAYHLSGKGNDRYISSTHNAVSWKDFLSCGKKLDPIAAVSDENALAAIVHTGGTTGLSKGVMLSNRNINAQAYQFSWGCLLESKRGESFLNLAPPFVAYGLCNSIHFPLCKGMELVLIPEHSPESFPQLIIRHRPNHVFCVPVLWDALVRAKESERQGFSYLQTIGSGADKMDVALENRINHFLSEHGCDRVVVQGYGMTETSAGICCSSPNEVLEPGSVGVPFSHTVISVFEPGTQNELSYDEQGEICISGPTVMLGYYNHEAETKELLQMHPDGRIWAHSGDLGHITRNGCLFIDGSIKRMIVLFNGFKVFPPNLEHVIMSHRAVSKCAVTGMRDPNNFQGFLPVAHIVLKPNCAGTQDEIRQEIETLCKASLPDPEQPYAYAFHDELPYTPIGKIDYRALEREGNG